MAQSGSLSTYLENLSPELRKYFKQPKDDGNLPTIEYSFLGSMFRKIASLILFPWTLFRTHLIREDEIGLIWSNEKAELLAPGWHTQLSPFTRFTSVVKATQDLIVHGPIKIISVKVGELAHVVDTRTGEPQLLTEGRHVINSPTLVFNKIINLNKPDTFKKSDEDEQDELPGNLRVVRIETGKRGMVYRSGELTAVSPGIHVIVPPDRFAGVVSIQQDILDLPRDAQYDTSDNVGLNIKADVFYTINDPIAAFTWVVDIVKNVSDTAKTVLSSIIRNFSLADISQGFRHADKANASDVGVPEGQQLAPNSSFYERVHDQFMENINIVALKGHGIEISNINMESLTIQDKDLAKDISSQALLYAQAQSKMIAAKNDATRMATEATGNANALNIKTEAEARATITRAEANKRSVELDGEALQSYAAKIGATPLGGKLALTQLQAKAMGNVSKVFYIPNHLAPTLTNFSLFSNQQQHDHLQNHDADLANRVVSLGND